MERPHHGTGKRHKAADYSRAYAGLRAASHPRMITVRRAHERRHLRRRNQDVWLTFLAGGFGALEQVEEERLAPGAGAARRSRRDIQILTYVREGVVTHEDSTGHAGIIHAGEFERLTAGSGIQHSETNASRTDEAHVFHVSVRPAELGGEPSRDQKRFFAADRRGALCVVASRDGRAGSLLMEQDALMYSTILESGQHVVHELAEGRRAWVHVVVGHVSLDDIILKTGDGAGLTAERAVALTAQERSELFLVDLANDPPSF